MRTILPAAVLLAAVPVFAGPGPAAPASAPVPPRSAEEIRYKLDMAEKRLELLVAAANVTPEQREIRAYKAYTPVTLQDPKKPIKIKRILEIVADEKGNAEVRDEGANAIIFERAIQFDCDLSLTGRAAGRPRAAFSVQVVRLLSDNDTLTRSLAKRILEGLWPAARDPRIHDYDPRKKDTFGQARAAWTEYLTK